MSELMEIEQKAKAYAATREELAEAVALLNAAIEGARCAHLPRIKRLVAKAAEHHNTLEASIEINRHLFISPRTAIFHGIKCGLTKGKGTIDWDNDAQVCELIEKHFPKLAKTLVKTTKKPLKKPLRNLSVEELQKIGCTVEATGDVIVIRPIDDQVEKAVNLLLADAIKSDTETQEAA